MAVIDSAIALYRAGNYSGSGDWLDESGSGFDLSVVGPAFTAQSGSNLAFFRFDGTNDYMRYALVGTELDPLLGDWTAIQVIRMASGTEFFPPIDTKDGFTTSSGFQIHDSGTNAATVAVADGSIEDQASTPTNSLTAGTIHEIGLRLDRTAEEIQAFIDGSASGAPTDTTGLGSVGSSAAHFDVGRVANTFISGDLFAIAIFDSALSDADIATAGDELTTLIPEPPDDDTCGCGFGVPCLTRDPFESTCTTRTFG